MKKLLIQFGLAIIVIIILISSYLFLPKYYKAIDDRLRDYLFIYRGPIQTTQNVVIVDIDEKSLKELGQWPWERNKFAKVLENLANAGVGIVGLDIVFAEPDGKSPAKVLENLGLEIPNLPDYDEILAKTVANTPTILGYVFALTDDGIKDSGDMPSLQALFIEKNKPKDLEFLITPHRAILNIPKIQDSAYSSGYFNTIPDDSGVIRSVPLLMKFHNMVVPSLSLEMLRAAIGVKKVVVNYDQTGVNSILLGDIEIPVDRHGRLFVNFRGGAKTFKYISAVDIYNNTFDKSLIEGKFVLIGTSAAGLLDLRSTPFESVYPGVEVHANVIDNILAKDFLHIPSWVDGANIILISSLVIVSFLVLYFAGAIISFIYIILSFSLVLFLSYYMLFNKGIALNILFPLSAIVLSFISAIVVNYFFESRQKEIIKGKLAKKVSPQVMEDILQNPDADILEGKEKEITIFFSDVRGFTTLSEAMGSPKALIELLNRYMTPMVEIIIHHEGTIDKFIGDAIMAYWNAPNDVKNHHDKAVRASILQLRELKKLNEELKLEGKPLIDIGIGINTGLSTVGEMGSAGRADYTVIGDPVNLASRLEGLNKAYGAHIIISEFTYNGLINPRAYTLRDLDLVRVKGKNEPVKIFEIIGFEEEKLKSQTELDRYHEALMFYRASEFKKALEIFSELQKDFSDKLYHVYVERCKEFIANPPQNFDGVYTFMTK